MNMIQDCSNVEVAKISFHRLMDKQTVAYPTMEYYSTIKRNKLSSRKTTQWKLKGILLNERSQSGKVYTVSFQLYDVREKEK